MEEFAIQIELKGHNLEQLLACFKNLQQQNDTISVMLVNYQNIKSNELSEQEINGKQFSNKKDFGLGRKGEEVLKLLSYGYTYNDIANSTGIGINGVRYYIKKAFRALNVNNGRDAVRVYLLEMKNKNRA